MKLEKLNLDLANKLKYLLTVYQYRVIVSYNKEGGCCVETEKTIL